MSIIDELRLLSPEQKLEIVTLLWDDLAKSLSLFQLPEDELAEMKSRRDQLQNAPLLAIDANEVWHQVDGELRKKL